jgi:SecD/SecF fusion protein
MVRELDVESTKPAPQPAATGASSRPAGGRRARARANGGTVPPATPPSSGSGNGEDDTSAKDRKPRNKRHGRPR